MFICGDFSLWLLEPEKRCRRWFLVSFCFPLVSFRYIFVPFCLLWFDLTWQVKKFLMDAKLPDPRPLIHVCDRHDFIEEMTGYLYKSSLQKYIEVGQGIRLGVETT